MFGQSKAKRVKVKVLEEYPHSTSSYTQGLFFYNNQMYESTGQYGDSHFIIVDYKTGKAIRKWKFNKRYFIEGSCVFEDRVYLLTWLEGECLVYTLPPNKKTTREDFKKIGVAQYSTEGWGITTDGKELIMSNGTSQLFFLDPASFYCRRTLNVTLDSKPIHYLNELEYIEGKIWANVYLSDNILIIDPSTGCVEVVIDCSGILPNKLKKSDTDVLNGIAYNPNDKSIFITGKYWPRLYKITY